MELTEIRAGNYVKGTKNYVKEFDFRALEPFFRVELQDFLYHNFLRPIPIDLEWCKRLNMDTTERIHSSGNYDWIAEVAGLKIRSDKGKIKVFHSTGGNTIILEHIKYVHQIQNFYYTFWGTEIDEPPRNATHEELNSNELLL